MKNYIFGIVLGVTAIICDLAIVGIPIGENVYAIGFLPGMVISIIGIIITKKNKEKYKIKLSFILNIVGLIIAILSLLMSISTGFIIK